MVDRTVSPKVDGVNVWMGRGTFVGRGTGGDIDGMLQRVREAGIRLAMVAVPASAAQDVADKLIEAGVMGILNYAPTTISVPEYVKLQYIDPVVHLQRMTFYVEPQPQA